LIDDGRLTIDHGRTSIVRRLRSIVRSWVTKNPDAGSGFDEVKYGYLLFSHRYAHINLPTMRGVNMMMVVLERVFHDGRYSMPGRGMSQGENCFLFSKCPMDS